MNRETKKNALLAVGGVAALALALSGWFVALQKNEQSQPSDLKEESQQTQPEVEAIAEATPPDVAKEALRFALSSIGPDVEATLGLYPLRGEGFSADSTIPLVSFEATGKLATELFAAMAQKAPTQNLRVLAEKPALEKKSNYFAALAYQNEILLALRALPVGPKLCLILQRDTVDPALQSLLALHPEVTLAPSAPLTALGAEQLAAKPESWNGDFSGLLWMDAARSSLIEREKILSQLQKNGRFAVLPKSLEPMAQALGVRKLVLSEMPQFADFKEKFKNIEAMLVLEGGVVTSFSGLESPEDVAALSTWLSGLKARGVHLLSASEWAL